MDSGYRTLNPATEERVRSYSVAREAEIEAALERSVGAFVRWRGTALSVRARILGAVADLLEAGASELAALMALEMGKPLAEGRAEAEKCAWGCRWYAENAEALLSDDLRESGGTASFVRYDPLGPVLAIMPWNFPFWQFFRFAAPTLMAGNTILLKHSPNTPGCALKIQSMMLQAGYPEGIVQSLFLDNEQAAGVIADPRVRGVTLTGSTRAGSQVAAVAGRSLKPMVLELGGSDPFIVFEDADLNRAVPAGIRARCQNSGQSCIASKRFLVHRDRFEEFADRFVNGIGELVVGDPCHRGVDVGPLARADLRDRLAEQVERTVAGGARVLIGGKTPECRGYFYPPTVLTDLPAGTPGADEELFGPVAVLIPFSGLREAIEIANSTRYGLGASVWTPDAGRVRDMVRELETGNVFVNSLVKSDPRLPFGGVKDSGFGRELAREGILGFVNAKTVWIA